MTCPVCGGTTDYKDTPCDDCYYRAWITSVTRGWNNPWDDVYNDM